MGILQPLVGEDSSGWAARRFRRRRFDLFRGLLSRLPRPLRLLDVGGTASVWKATGLAAEADVEVTILNVEPVGPTSDRIVAHRGDARSMPEFDDGAFHVVFSNSVIEHVGDDADRRRMAREVRRVGRRYFVQTPNRYFPLEPHFLVPGFQFLPEEVQVALVSHFDVGQFRRRDAREARELVRSVRLLDRRELQRLFPEAWIQEERIVGLTKSLMAIGRFD